ncbi:MAG: YggS family pyridoxal phosphate-dependent enzyme [Dehalococcoidia bacterium]|nr:YggS family pyridoxal phosphate-dependent enzyme [Dehalococcoidia bacterium]
MATICENIQTILAELPSHVQLVAVAKTRTADEVTTALNAGVSIIGENYVQEGINHSHSANIPCLHFIGSLQKNKVRQAVKLFNMIETVDSVALANQIEKECAKQSKTMPVLIEVNSGREKQKSGVLPENAPQLIKAISEMAHLHVEGIMTMGPLACLEQELRSCFNETRQLYEHIATMRLANVEMKYLSMGMSDSYRLAVEEGANIVRLGSCIFGPRF